MSKAVIYPICEKIKECKALNCYFCHNFSHFEPKIKEPDPEWRKLLRRNRRRGKYAERAVTKRWPGARRVVGSGSGEEKGDIIYLNYLFQEKATQKDDQFYFLLKQAEEEVAQASKEEKEVLTPLLVLECGDEIVLAMDGDDFARYMKGEKTVFYTIHKKLRSYKTLFRWLNKAREDSQREYQRTGTYFLPGVIRYYSRHHKGKMVVFVERLSRKEERDGSDNFTEIEGTIEAVKGEQGGAFDPNQPR